MTATSPTALFSTETKTAEGVFLELQKRYQDIDGKVQKISSEVIAFKLEIDNVNKTYDAKQCLLEEQTLKRNICILRYQQFDQQLSAAKNFFKDLEQGVSFLNKDPICEKDRETIACLDPKILDNIDALFEKAQKDLEALQIYKTQLSRKIDDITTDLTLVKDHGLRTICQRIDAGGAPLTGVPYVVKRGVRYLSAFSLPVLTEEQQKEAQRALDSPKEATEAKE